MKKIIVISILVFGIYNLQAQTKFINGSFQLSNTTYPGLNAEHETVFINKDKTKTTKKGKIKNKSRQIIGGINAGFYVHPNSHFGVISTYDIKYQKLTKKQFYYNTGLGFGFNTNFIGETYKVTDAGEVKRVPLSSSSYLTPHFQLTAGRQFKKSGLIDAIFIKQNIHLLLFYNYTHLPIYNTEIGLRFNLTSNKK